MERCSNKPLILVDRDRVFIGSQKTQPPMATYDIWVEEQDFKMVLETLMREPEDLQQHPLQKRGIISVKLFLNTY